MPSLFSFSTITQDSGILLLTALWFCCIPPLDIFTVSTCFPCGWPSAVNNLTTGEKIPDLQHLVSIKMSHITAWYIQTSDSSPGVTSPSAHNITGEKIKLIINSGHWINNKVSICTSVQHGNNRLITPPTWRRVHRVFAHTRDFVSDYQLSESTSLLPSSVFSADALHVFFHFWEFSDSSDEDLFCRLHFARLFLNQTYVVRK